MNKHAETFVHAVIAGNTEQAEQAFQRGLAEKAIAALEVRKLALVDQVFNNTKAKSN
jgi:hypothetical protein